MAKGNSVPSSVYTVLVIVSMLALLAGVIFVAMRSNELFGTPNPLDAPDLSMLMPAGLASLFS